MFREIVFCALVFCGVQKSESALTVWSGDGTLTGADGTITLTAPLPEDSAAGTTVVSLTAASDGTAISGYTVTGTPSVVTLADVTSHRWHFNRNCYCFSANWRCRPFYNNNKRAMRRGWFRSR
ncbi:uncharacterized protein LOC128241294 [Mya arenaria]|uniref:uncharacterized protein LOC128241294 n=1 Tax=Mya arenaria TaxID=6604 RepID=UPI0022E10D71|nr:uncharacterized protein LOC128241294 [Mya arenaria]